MRNSAKDSYKDQKKEPENQLKIIYNAKAEDFLSKLDFKARSRILNSIKSKLSVNPVFYGKPLQGLFRGYYKFRVGYYRIVYQIEGNFLMVIILVSYRKDVYNKLRLLL